MSGLPPTLCLPPLAFCFILRPVQLSAPADKQVWLPDITPICETQS